MVSRRIKLLSAVLGAVAVAALVAWSLGSRIESPADAAARTAPPKPSPILVPVERRVLGANIVTRGTARFGLPQPVSIAPSMLKPAPGLVAVLPARNTQVPEGDSLLSASGRPVFVLQGEVPAYRDLAPGIQGEDVRQLEQALRRLKFDPGPVDGRYDDRTAAAVARWYRAKGWEPFGPTQEQQAAIRGLERDAGEASKQSLATRAALAAAAPAVEAARATAERNARAAAVELGARLTELQTLQATGDAALSLALQNERAKAANTEAAAEADLAAQTAEEAYVSLDPRQPETARVAARTRLEMARTAVARTRAEGRSAVLAAERALAGLPVRLAAAEAAVDAARQAEKAVALEGARAVQAALDGQKLAALESQLAERRAAQLATELAQARARVGVQVPVDEIVFIHALPVRVEELKLAVGAPASGTVLTVTDNELSVDAALPLDASALVEPGMKVAIDEPSLGVSATGVVRFVASTPGTRGVDGFHIYCEIKVDPTPVRLEGFSLRLTIPIKSTGGPVIAVPVSALSLAADGSSRVLRQVQDDLRYVTVKPGLSADGFVEVTPVDGTLEPGSLVVVGYNQPTEGAPK